MFRLSALAALLAVTMPAWAQDAPVPLSKEEILGADISSPVTLPMPSELFAALGKQGKPDWTTLLRKSPAANFTNRQQIALNLGGLIADGYLAVEAQDSQQVKNIGSDIRAMAKALGVDQALIERGKKIADFAEEKNWDALMEELEAAQDEVINAMSQNKDQDLVTLVMLGGWLRGTEVVTAYVSKHYTPEAAKVLRQPAVVDHFVKKLAAMPKRVLDTNLMDAVRMSLFDIRKAVTYPADTTPSAEDVTKLNDLATKVMKIITTK